MFQVEAGDIILKVNETDVHLFSTKEGEFFSIIISQIVYERNV